MRVMSDRPAKNGGWIHIGITDNNHAEREHYRHNQPPFDADKYVTWLRSRQGPFCKEGLQELGDRVGGLPASFLVSEGVMWEPERKAVAFSMMDANQRVVGIRLRWNDGGKGSICGSKSGVLFNPTITNAHTVYVVEGQTDYLAARYMGLICISRPSCLGQEQIVADLCQKWGAKTVIVVPDIDTPQEVAGKLRMSGRTGAIKLASYIKAIVLLRLPMAKDVRQWVLRDGYDAVKRVMLSWQLKPIIEEMLNASQEHHSG